jgi:ketosteroid isomerase-like protein
MRLLPLLLLAGCAHTAARTVRNDPGALLDADRAFAADVAKRGLDAWSDAFTADGVAFPANAPLTVGRGAIRELMAPAFATSGFRIEWTPQRADASGDLGYTIGFYEVHAPKNGTDVVTRGKYLTVWKRQPNGAWKVAADAGTPGQ